VQCLDQPHLCPISNNQILGLRTVHSVENQFPPSSTLRLHSQDIAIPFLANETTHSRSRMSPAARSPSYNSLLRRLCSFDSFFLIHIYTLFPPHLSLNLLNTTLNQSRNPLLNLLIAQSRQRFAFLLSKFCLSSSLVYIFLVSIPTHPSASRKEKG
jgi:hypothetical protein